MRLAIIAAILSCALVAMAAEDCEYGIAGAYRTLAYQSVPATDFGYLWRGSAHVGVDGASQYALRGPLVVDIGKRPFTETVDGE